MEAKTEYEESILKAMQGLSLEDQRRLSRMIHFVKNEIMPLDSDEKKRTEAFLSVCGTWEDEKTVEEQIHAIYSARKSRQKVDGILFSATPRNGSTATRE
jgi:hypothetical protein